MLNTNLAQETFDKETTIDFPRIDARKITIGKLDASKYFAIRDESKLDFLRQETKKLKKLKTQMVKQQESKMKTTIYNALTDVLIILTMILLYLSLITNQVSTTLFSVCLILIVIFKNDCE